MLHFPVKFKDQNASNVTVYINLNITNTLYSVAKITARLIPPDWKPNRVNLAPISSNVSTVKATTKLTLIFVFSGNTSSIANNIQKNTKKFVIQKTIDSFSCKW